MSTELLPCPFCGEKPIMQTSKRWPGDVDAAVDGYTVVCLNIDCILGGDDEWYSDTEVEAVEAWNTRAPTTIGGVQVEIEPTVFGMTLDEVRQMMKRDAERERTCTMRRTSALEQTLSAIEFRSWCVCSNCGLIAPCESRYCPNCGAKVVD